MKATQSTGYNVLIEMEISQQLLNKLQDSNIEIKISYLELILEPIILGILERQKKIEMDAKPLMTIADIAEKFKVTKTTVQNWIRRGTITGQKVGKNRYFTHEEVSKALGQYGWESRLRKDWVIM